MGPRYACEVSETSHHCSHQGESNRWEPGLATPEILSSFVHGDPGLDSILTPLGIPCYIVFDGDEGIGERKCRNAAKDEDPVNLESSIQAAVDKSMGRADACDACQVRIWGDSQTAWRFGCGLSSARLPTGSNVVMYRSYFHCDRKIGSDGVSWSKNALWQRLQRSRVLRVGRLRVNSRPCSRPPPTQRARTCRKQSIWSSFTRLAGPDAPIPERANSACRRCPWNAS